MSDTKAGSGSRWSARAAGRSARTSPAGSGTRGPRSSRSPTSTPGRAGRGGRASSACRAPPPTTASCWTTRTSTSIDVVTGNRPHFQISWDALSAGKHVLCEKPVHTDYRKTREAAELAAAKGLRTKLGFTFRYAPAVRYAKELIDSGLRRRAVHLQRLRAEQPVDRPGHAAAPGRPGRRPGADRGVLDRGLRRADHRHHALVARRAADRGGRHHAQLRAGADDPRHRPDDQGQHRRRRHVDRRVRLRRAGLDPVLLRDRRQLPRHRGPDLRLGGRDHRPAGRRVRHLPDDQDGDARTRSSSSSSRSRPGSSRPAATPASRGSSCSTPTWSPTSPDEILDTGRPEPGRLRPGRAGAGDHQRVRGVVPAPGPG